MNPQFSERRRKHAKRGLGVRIKLNSEEKNPPIHSRRFGTDPQNARGAFKFFRKKMWPSENTVPFLIRFRFMRQISTTATVTPSGCYSLERK